MTRLRGRCLCDAVSFEVRASALKLYRCHCTLCRRQSGTASNCAAIVDAADFAWVSGAGQIRSWRKATGYRSDVCGVCGSPVPNPLESRAAFWVPAGLLDPGGVLSVVAPRAGARGRAIEPAPVSRPHAAS